MARCKPTARRLSKPSFAALFLALQTAVAFAGLIRQARYPPAQPLSFALRTLTSQAGAAGVHAEAIGVFKAAAIKGEMSVEAALEQLLAGSGLRFKQEGERAITGGDRRFVVWRNHAAGNGTATRTERPADLKCRQRQRYYLKDVAQRNLANVQDLPRTVESIEVGQQLVAQASGIDTAEWRPLSGADQ
ncbi:hypothetical protein MASR1M60_32330 [Rhodocyclaceae bacterium]